MIRVCHDKIFISYRQIEYFLTRYLEGKFEYVYSTNFIPGMGFEVFSAAILAKAHATFENVEHLSYAVESVAKNVLKLLQFPQSRTWLNRVKPHCGLRLLIDFPEDVEAVEALMIKNGNNCDIQDIVSSIGNKPQPNAMPDITVYTCSFEDTEFLDRCINSVLSQSFYNFEYILLDDGSKKNEVHKFMRRYRKDKRVRVLRNRENIGLASSSNVATKAARGRYVIRLDADDHFVDERVLERMARHMEINNTDILYPHNYKDGRIQHGSEQHHVGGAMFKRRMLEFIRFTDGLRHYDGLDLYYRAMTASARIDYFDEPTFYYRQRANSMSKSKSNARMEIGGKIKKGVVGNALLEGEK